MHVIGVTGGIGTGKSTLARMLRFAGIPVQGSDHVVHELMSHDTDVRKELAILFPAALQGEAFNRQLLWQEISRNSSSLGALENLLHPRVRARHVEFVTHQRNSGASMIALDIPLLFEAGWQDLCDFIVVTDCAPDIQLRRVLARPGMTLERYEYITNKQWTASEKCKYADHIVNTDLGLADTFQQLRRLIAASSCEMNQSGKVF